MKRATLRNALAAVALVAIAACNAANGGNNATTVPGMAPAAGTAVAPDRRHKRPPNKTKQRSLATAALSVAGSSIELDQFGSQDGLLSQLLNFGHNVARTHRSKPRDTGTPQCNNGVEYSWSNSNGQVDQTIEFFYDSACTQPENLITLNATFSSAGGNATGTQETWDTNGVVIGYQTYTATFTPGIDGGIGQINVLKTSAAAPSASPSSQSGFTCLFNTGNAVDCGSGTVVSIPLASPSPEEVGFEQTVVGTFVTPSPSPSTSASPAPSPTTSTSPEPSEGPNWGHGGGGGHGGPPGGGWQGGPSGLQLQINGIGYSGALGALTLAAGTPPAWTITGGTQNATLTGTAFIGFGGFNHGHGGGWHDDRRTHDHGGGGNGGGGGGNGGGGGGSSPGGPGPGSMTSIDLTLNDTADGLTVTITSAGFGKLSGAVTQTATGQAVATMSLDFSGTGTITYTSGEVDQVKDWIIVT
jgi:hypothetical protein